MPESACRTVRQELAGKSLTICTTLSQKSTKFARFIFPINSNTGPDSYASPDHAQRFLNTAAESHIPMQKSQKNHLRCQKSRSLDCLKTIDSSGQIVWEIAILSWPK